MIHYITEIDYKLINTALSSNQILNNNRGTRTMFEKFDFIKKKKI